MVGKRASQPFCFILLFLTIHICLHSIIGGARLCSSPEITCQGYLSLAHYSLWLTPFSCQFHSEKECSLSSTSWKFLIVRISPVQMGECRLELLVSGLSTCSVCRRFKVLGKTLVSHSAEPLKSSYNSQY